MKKVIVVLCIFVCIIVAMTAELVVTDKIYAELIHSLVAVELSMEENPKQLGNPKTLQAVKNSMDIWQRNRKYLFTVNNHLSMRNLDEKLLSLQKQLEINADQDAPVTIAVLLSLLSELRQDSYPIMKNIL